MIGWIRRHFRVWTDDKPSGPVLYDLNARRYLICEVKLFGLVATFSIDLRN